MREHWLVMSHFFDFIDKRPYLGKERRKMRPFAETFQMPDLACPFYSQDKAIRICRALGEFVSNALGRCFQMSSGATVGVKQFARSVRCQLVADIFNRQRRRLS